MHTFIKPRDYGISNFLKKWWKNDEKITYLQKKSLFYFLDIYNKGERKKKFILPTNLIQNYRKKVYFTN